MLRRFWDSSWRSLSSLPDRDRRLVAAQQRIAFIVGRLIRRGVPRSGDVALAHTRAFAAGQTGLAKKGAQPAIRRRRVELALVKKSELVEAALLRAETRRGAEVPFAHEPGRVARGLEKFGERLFAPRQPRLSSRFLLDRICLVSEAHLMPPGDQPGAARRAIRRGDVALRETDAIARERVDVRRRNLRPAVAGEIAVAEVVGDEALTA